MKVEMNPDGSATIKFDGPEDMDRHSLCIQCMEVIGNEAYCQIQLSMAKSLVHKRCLGAKDKVVEEHDAAV